MLRLFFLASLFWGLAPAGAQGPKPAPFLTSPRLVVETGMHTAAINAVATDTANRYLVTASDDKTVRLWSRANGDLLKVIRLPIGDGPEGRPLSVAMAPDASRIAVGGILCRSYEGTFCIFIFDTASGRMLHRITGLSHPARRLEWAPDGSFLAAGLGTPNEAEETGGGVRLFRTSDWSEAARDDDYAGFMDNMHFDGRGRLATVAWDGFIRVYRYGPQGLTLLRKKAAADLNVRAPSPNRGKPRGVSFSPDGTRLAVSQAAGANWVTILDPDTLDTLYTASTAGMPGSGANFLGWSSDGSYLYGGVASAERRPLFVRRWGSGGRGFATDLPTGQDFTNGIVVLNDGSVVSVTAEPLIAVFDARGEVAWQRRAQGGHFYGTTELFKVSRDGARVEFSYDGTGRSLMNFDVGERRLAAGSVSGVPMAEAATAGGGLNFFNLWRDTRNALTVGKRRLAMGPFENSRSLAIAPDFKTFVVGTRNYVRHYTRGGAPLWSAPTLADAYAINFSGDGRMIVAAVGDGTVRWYRRRDGRVLATLYVAPDRKRWVIASPTGFYDANVGAEDFLGWHINRSRDQEADFFPMSRLRARFYKPEVVATILRTADDREAIRLAAGVTAPPPAVAVVAPPPKPMPVVVEPPKPVPVPAPVVIAPPKPPPEPAPVVAEPPKPAPPVVVAPEPPKPAPPVVAEPPKPSPPVIAVPVPVPIPVPVPPVIATPLPVPTPAPAPPAPAEEAVVAVEQPAVDITQFLPPVVTILSPAPGMEVSSNTVTLRYSVRSAKDAPVLDVRTRVNGLTQAARNLVIASAGDIREVTVTVPSEDSEILVFAENRNGISTAATVRLKWAGKPPAPAVAKKPMLYVLAIGVSDYENQAYRLNYAAKDAKDFVSVVQAQKGRLYEDVVVRLVTDRQATSRDVVEGFDWLQKQVTPQDVGMVFLAGHGINDDKGRYYFLPANADVDRLSETGVPFNDIRSRLAKLNGKGLMFVDTCHSGNVMGGRKDLSTDVNGMLNDLGSPEYGLVVLASSTGKQFSLEDAAWGNGAFTKALVEGLGGQADLKKRGRITHKMLDFYVSDRVEELTKGRQTPVNPSPQGVPDYAVALTGQS